MSMSAHRPFDILYCHAPPTARKIEPGHWFFHTGQYAVCAAASKDADGRWHLQVYWDREGKERPEGRTFDSIDKGTPYPEKT